MISREKWDKLKERMEKLEISEETLIERFILGSGSGGQKVNKTNSCVYLKDPKSEIEVKCQKARGRDENRYHARKDLCDKLEEQIFQKKSLRAQEIAKIRKQKKRRSRKLQQKNIEEKRHRSAIKEGRKPPSED